MGELEFDLIEAAFVAQQIPLVYDELFEEFEGGFAIGLVGAQPAVVESVEVFLFFIGEDEDVGAAAVFDAVFAGVELAFWGVWTAAAMLGWLLVFLFFFFRIAACRIEEMLRTTDRGDSLTFVPRSSREN